MQLRLVGEFMASVSVEFSTYSDPRYKRLGKLTGTDPFSAIGRASALWMYCTERGNDVHEMELVDIFVEVEGFALALVKSELAEKVSDTHIRIHGGKGRIEWLVTARERQKRYREKKRSVHPDQTIDDVTVTSRLRPGSGVEAEAGVGVEAGSKNKKEPEISKTSSALRENSAIPSDVKSEWESTLSHFGKTANWARDESPLYRAYQRVKEWDRVRNALAGFRFETKSRDYDPATQVYIRRLEDPKKFDRLENLGEQGLAGNLSAGGDTDWKEVFKTKGGAA